MTTSPAPQCPKCQAMLQDDYGMIACPSCGVMLFLDMEGIAHISSDDDPPPPVADLAPPPLEEEQAVAIEPFASHIETMVPTGEDGSFDLAEPPLQMEESPASEAFSTAPEPLPAEPEASPSEDADFSMDAMLGYQSEEPAPEASAPAEFGGPGDPLGLNGYANSEVSQAKDGLLTFKILISGIDSKEMRNSLREALEDARFGWSAGEVMARINKGRLELDNVAPVKATILINRIKRLPIEIRWEQYAITQMDDQES